ncbi:MAG: hypothetical protein JJE22_13625 [Bacteroidia bacterium]|nr:hypothetical protein [Bacteroidia bacterium]
MSISVKKEIKIWVLLQLLIISIDCYSQNDILSFTVSYSRSNKSSDNSIRKVDSIAHRPGIASHFAKIYSQSMTNIAKQTQSMGSEAKLFINKFEITFANYFINAFVDYENGTLAESSDWKCYFSNPTIQPWQFVLLGVNTHINIDMWRSLADNFSEKEIRQNKKLFLTCQSSVKKTYRQFFDTLLMESTYLRFINSFAKGFPQKLGEMIVYKWRKRNVKLAILYYYRPEKFEKKFARIKKKKQRIDNLILTRRSVSL